MTSLETVSEAEVEAVARAIAAADDDEEPYWDDLKPYWKEHYCKCARAALTAAAQVRERAASVRSMTAEESELVARALIAGTEA